MAGFFESPSHTLEQSPGFPAPQRRKCSFCVGGCASPLLGEAEMGRLLSHSPEGRAVQTGSLGSPSAEHRKGHGDEEMPGVPWPSFQPSCPAWLHPGRAWTLCCAHRKGEPLRPGCWTASKMLWQLDSSVCRGWGKKEGITKNVSGLKARVGAVPNIHQLRAAARGGHSSSPLASSFRH